jgi:hypothetical protein
MPSNSVFELRHAAAEPLETVVLQTRTIGSEIDYANLRLTYDLGAGEQALAAARTELLRTPGGLGDSVSSLWTWDLTVTPGITQFTIQFAAAASSLSFDSATLDVKSVPEPGAAALLTAGLGALALRGWTRRLR